MTHKSDENLSFEVQNVHVRDEDFSCSLDVLYGGLGISKLQFEEKKYKFFSALNFPIFGHQDPGSGSALTKNARS
jgi:hypothetical protein